MRRLLSIALMLPASFSSAELVRVFYRPDNTVAVLRVAPQACSPKEKPASCLSRIAKRDCPHDDRGACLPFDDMDDSRLPDRAKRGKWRAKKGQGIKVDETIVTPEEHRASIEKELDDELSKPTPDPIKALKLQRQLDKLRKG